MKNLTGKILNKILYTDRYSKSKGKTKEEWDDIERIRVYNWQKKEKEKEELKVRK